MPPPPFFPSPFSYPPPVRPRARHKDVDCLKRARPDELWVPTSWHAEVYAATGAIDFERIFVLPEIVDTVFFDRSLCEPRAVESAPPPPYLFLSIFKWEWRKGWDVLLLAYWKAFDRPKGEERANVILKLKTFKPPLGLLEGVYFESGTTDIMEQIEQIAELMMGKSMAELPRVQLITQSMAKEEIRQLYAEADVFVLPTRGEGWGLPIVEVGAPARSST